MQITFNTMLDNVTYKHYRQQPRQAIENNLIKKINQNPNLINLLNRFPQPVIRYTLVRYWGFHHDGPNEDCLNYPYNWRNIEPNLQPIDVTNHA